MKRYESENTMLTDIINEIETKLKLDKFDVDQARDKEYKEFENKAFATVSRWEKDEEEGEFPRMSTKFFNKLLCSNYQLYYRTYELNECLYLHFKGFKIIENLEAFTNLKVLYLEGNCIKKIEGLNNLKHLTSLYLHENMIEKIENLEGLNELYNLNLSDNVIESITGLSELPKLSNLLLKRNRIGTNGAEDLKGLIGLNISVLDLSDNRIDCTNVLTDYMNTLPKLRVLYLQGNECVRKIANYRKTFISTLKELNYLDDKPVFEDERRFSEAFSKGGLEEERKERALYKKEKHDAEMQRLQDFTDMVNEWKGVKTAEKVSESKEDNVDRDAEKKKLLEKCKKKVPAAETKPTPSGEIFEENDLPDLETVQHLKNEGYIEHEIAKQQKDFDELD
jgi:dynein assembly factor 1